VRRFRRFRIAGLRGLRWLVLLVVGGLLLLRLTDLLMVEPLTAVAETEARLRAANAINLVALGETGKVAKQSDLVNYEKNQFGDIVAMNVNTALVNRIASEVASKVEAEFKDLNDALSVEDASVVVLNITLQFVRPLFRDRLVRSIFDGLNENGCLIIVEKVLGNDSLFNRLFIKLYYDMKRRNDYSDTEIAQKREALENVLIPYRIDENFELLKRAGFGSVDTFYKWYNFAGLIAVKTAQ
jgi:tRNA (cmo5U34)-methyltransferase